MDLALGMEVFKTSQKLATDDGNLRFAEDGRLRFELRKVSVSAGSLLQQGTCRLTKSKHEPPPKYSMTIHNLLPRRKLALYWVTWELAQVLRTEISAWIS